MRAQRAQRGFTMTPSTRAGTVLGIAVALCGATAFAGPPTAAALPSDSVYQLKLLLTDQQARTADWRTRRGKPQLVSMFYTSCQYVCPLVVDSGKAIERQLSSSQQGNLGILLISMDPKRDDSAALQAVVAKRKLDTQHWTLAAPRPGDVRAVAGVLGIRYRALADGEFNHTTALILLDGEGRIVARTEQMGSTPDPDFVAAVRKATGS